MVSNLIEPSSPGSVGLQPPCYPASAVTFFELQDNILLLGLSKALPLSSYILPFLLHTISYKTKIAAYLLSGNVPTPASAPGCQGSLMTWESDYRVTQQHGYHSISIMDITVSWVLQHHGHCTNMPHCNIMSIAASRESQAWQHHGNHGIIASWYHSNIGVTASHYHSITGITALQVSQ